MYPFETIRDRDTAVISRFIDQHACATVVIADAKGGSTRTQVPLMVRDAVRCHFDADDVPKALCRELSGTCSRTKRSDEADALAAISQAGAFEQARRKRRTLACSHPSAQIPARSSATGVRHAGNGSADRGDDCAHPKHGPTSSRERNGDARASADLLATMKFILASNDKHPHDNENRPREQRLTSSRQ